mmetsp:Transcript_19348/g.68438  ORF Transcript_19348/g.68438 Transcript_19348/m.68438 type:complete len:214 (-) Transcript_19348:165-806(-)
MPASKARHSARVSTHATSAARLPTQSASQRMTCSDGFAAATANGVRPRSSTAVIVTRYALRRCRSSGSEPACATTCAERRPRSPGSGKSRITSARATTDAAMSRPNGSSSPDRSAALSASLSRTQSWHTLKPEEPLPPRRQCSGSARASHVDAVQQSQARRPQQRQWCRRLNTENASPHPGQTSDDPSACHKRPSASTAAAPHAVGSMTATST